MSTPEAQTFDLEAATTKLSEANAAGHVTDSAVENIKKWLTETRYAEYAADVAQHIADEKWQALDDAFWTVIPFGTGGRRGRMYPIGSNAINDRTIGESAQGLATYVKSQHDGNGPLSCAIAFDTRINSVHFSKLCAGIMVANGFQVYYLDEIRSTPELSFLVRYKNCSCGIMVTASHNPPSDNAVKVYWSTGGQILPPHDKAIIDNVMTTDEIQVVEYEEALAAGKVTLCKDEVDAAFIGEVKAQRFDGPRDLKIIYSPLHGVGSTAAVPALKADGFTDVEVFGPHAEPDGNFPNVPGNVSNPENVEVFDAIIVRGKEAKADIILTTDPDCDRLGVAAPIANGGDEWATINGNQIGALLTDFILEQRSKAGSLSPDHYIIKTLVTTEMIRRIADSYNVKTEGDLQVGFKWIGGVMDDKGPGKFVFGTEESHGYLVGQYARDKDGAVACMLMCELAAKLKAEGQTLHEKLEALHWQHGYHAERLVSIYMEGASGMARMESLMNKLRNEPPQEVGGFAVAGVRDYQDQVVRRPDGSSEPMVGPPGNLLIFDLAEDGNYVAVRPSGTEPKVKLYMFTYVAPEQLHDMEATKNDMNERLDNLAAGLQAVADSV
jgi:phosphomannomutase